MLWLVNITHNVFIILHFSKRIGMYENNSHGHRCAKWHYCHYVKALMRLHKIFCGKNLQEMHAFQWCGCGPHGCCMYLFELPSGSHCAGLFSSMVLGASSSAPNLQDYARAHRKKLTSSGFLDGMCKHAHTS